MKQSRAGGKGGSKRGQEGGRADIAEGGGGSREWKWGIKSGRVGKQRRGVMCGGGDGRRGPQRRAGEEGEITKTRGSGGQAGRQAGETRGR